MDLKLFRRSSSAPAQQEEYDDPFTVYQERMLKYAPKAFLAYEIDGVLRQPEVCVKVWPNVWESFSTGLEVYGTASYQQLFKTDKGFITLGIMDVIYDLAS